MKKIILLPIMLIIINVAFAQETNFSKSSLKYSFGFTGRNESPAGTGVVFTAGYQYSAWKGRLRFNPNFAISRIDSRKVMSGDANLSTNVCMEGIVSLDIIRIKGVSLMLGLGPCYGRVSGLNVPYQGFPQYYSRYLYSTYAGLGFRINPKKSPIACELVPINIRINKGEQVEFSARIVLELKIKKTMKK